jgi:hypothetical protein
MGAQDRFVIQRTAQRLGARYIVLFQEGTSRRHQRNAAATRESRRPDERF